MSTANERKKQSSQKALLVIKAMASEGYSSTEIASAIGYHRATVSNLMSKYNIEKGSKNKKNVTSIKDILEDCNYSLEDQVIVHTNSNKYTYDKAISYIAQKGPGSIITYEELEEIMSFPAGVLDDKSKNAPCACALRTLRNNKLQPLGLSLQRCYAQRLFKVKLHKTNVVVNYDNNKEDIALLQAQIKQLKKQNQEYYNVNQELLLRVNELEQTNEALLNVNSDTLSSAELAKKVYAYQEIVQSLKSQIALLYSMIADI